MQPWRDIYYERLLSISRDNDWTGWCCFFLEALTEQARENHQKATDILSLYEAERTRIVELTRSQYAVKALDFLFMRPVFQASAFTTESDIPKSTANRILKTLRDNGLFRVLRPAEGRKSAVFAFRELLNIAEGREVF